ncbi:MAG: hypothetical protein J7M17_03560 [Anaerolineae bacterium]|nr:hypothetical protein [Anaerolineae bacterium]
MKRFLMPSEIVKDIEIELLQGTLSKDDLGQGIVDIRQYQNQLRVELLAALAEGRSIDMRELVARQFQCNDLVLTLLQETVKAVRRQQITVWRLADRANSEEKAVPDDEPILADTWATSELDRYEENWPPPEVMAAMKAESLEIGMLVKGVKLPLIGGLLRRLRIALHNLVLFYLGRLIERQAKVNYTYGDWVLRLGRQCQDQHAQIRTLTAQVDAFRQQLDAL